MLKLIVGIPVSVTTPGVPVIGIPDLPNTDKKLAALLRVPTKAVV
jgi:hypothetical protein